MRAIALTLLIYGLLAGPPAMAASGGEKTTNETPAATSKAPSTATSSGQPVTAKAASSSAAPVTESEMQQLRDLLQAQQAEIQALREQLGAVHASSNASANAGTATSTGSSAPVTPAATATVAESSPQSGGSMEEKKSPLSFKIGSAEFTPGGFVDFTSYFRSTNTGNGIGTGFNSIPFNNDASGKGGQTESRFSAQNSRVTLKAEAPVAGGTVTGYLESDFLGNAPSNLNVTSNSNTLRMRVYFVDYRRAKWEFLGGQDWSMLTPNRKGIGVMPSDIFYTQNMDTNYQVGLVWARQAQFRLLYHPTDSWTLGFSVENPDQYTGSAVTFPSCFTGASPCTSQTNQVDQGTGTSSPAVHPDFIVKVARDQNVGGRNWHFEAAGVLSTYKLYTPTSANGANATTSSKTGGGISVNANLELFKNFHFIANTFWSDGDGRYIFGLGPNFIVNQNPDTLNFSPALVHAGSGIGGFEWQVTKNSLFYGYYGGAYYGRTVGTDPLTGNPVGYGYSGSPSSNNRAMQEGTAGVIQTFWKNPNYGALQLITQLSYLTRAPWFVAPTEPKNAHLTMAYVDLRYVLP